MLGVKGSETRERIGKEMFRALRESVSVMGDVEQSSEKQ